MEKQQSLNWPQGGKSMPAHSSPVRQPLLTAQMEAAKKDKMRM
jgi:hypothetical protein